MSSGVEQNVYWNDWQAATEIETIEGDWSDATPLCPRCFNEVSPLDHYCGQCWFAVGQFTPFIPYVNIRVACEPFEIMWERLWRPRSESRMRRCLYVVFLGLGGLVTGWIFFMPFAALAWWLYPPKAPGSCHRCGYDLRASSERCPECGAAIGTESTSTDSCDRV